MRLFYSILIIVCCTFSSKAQLQFPFRDTTLQVGQSIPQFCINTQYTVNDTLVFDDRFSHAIDIGFTFSFFGIDYTQCIVSDNLLLSFDTTFANFSAPFQWTSTGSMSLRFRNAILPAFMDLYMLYGGKIRITTNGNIGAKKFIIEWCGVPKYSSNAVCNNDKVSIQVVLHEGTNIIDINTLLINGSSTCPATNTTSKGIQGLINIDNSVSIFTPGRGITDMWGNTGITNNTVRFIPSAGGYTIDQNSPFLYEPIFINDSFTNISWYSSLGGAALATGACIDIPYDTSIDYYVAQYNNYQSCDSSLRNFNDTIWVHSVPDNSTKTANINTASKGKIKVYPNPVSRMKELRIESAIYKINKIRIVNAMGHTIEKHSFFNKSQQSYTLSIGDYPTGIYLLIIETSEGIFTEQISIN